MTSCVDLQGIPRKAELWGETRTQLWGLSEFLNMLQLLYWMDRAVPLVGEEVCYAKETVVTMCSSTFLLHLTLQKGLQDTDKHASLMTITQSG